MRGIISSDSPFIKVPFPRTGFPHGTVPDQVDTICPTKLIGQVQNCSLGLLFRDGFFQVLSSRRLREITYGSHLKRCVVKLNGGGRLWFSSRPAQSKVRREKLHRRTNDRRLSKLANAHAHEAADHQTKAERRANQEDGEFKRHKRQLCSRAR